MKKNIYRVYDSAAEVYSEMFSELNHATAIRAFAQAVNREGHQWNVHARDYTLMHVGVDDNKTGMPEPLSPAVAVRVVTAVEVLEPDVEEAEGQMGLGIA